MNSILQDDKTHCFICGRNGAGDPLEKHHIFGGSRRDFSEEDGLYVWLCGSRCHRNGVWSAHKDKKTAKKLHIAAQRAWQEYYGKTVDDFRQRYGTNYL